MTGVTSEYLVCGYDRVLPGYGLLFDENNGQIMAVCTNEKIRAERPAHLIEGDHSLLLPGFVNCHTHQYGILSHGIPLNVQFHDFEGFLKDYWWPWLEDRIGCEEALATSLVSCGQMLHSGVTSFIDTLEAPNVQPGTLEMQADQIEKVGMRAIVSLESSQRVSEDNGEACLAQNVAAVRYCRTHLNHVRGAVCTHTSFTCDEDFIRKGKRLAREEQALFQFHLSESRYEPSVRPEPVACYDRLSALDADTLASQCVQLTEKELELLAERRARVVHMPLSNCEVGGGFAPVPAMLDKGIPVALGSDGYIDDFFAVMKGAFLIHKANLQSTTVMPADQVFRMATEYGAQCMGLKKVGRLEEGWQADFSCWMTASYHL